MLSDATLRYGEEMLDVLLGVDASSAPGVRRRRWTGGHEHGRRPCARTVSRALRQRAPGWLSLGKERRLPEVDRQRYYRQLCSSTLALLDWREGGLPFAEQLARFLHVPAAPMPDDEMDRLRAEMRALLGGMGSMATWRTLRRLGAAQPGPARRGAEGSLQAVSTRRGIARSSA